jgi:SAM-dependent methyltransferase
MHDAARDFIAKHAKKCKGPVLEVGSRDINGGVRDLLPKTGYVGIDLVAGRGVDQVVDVRDFTYDTKFGTVVCCEVLEHHPSPQELIAAMAEHLLVGGTLLITAAGPDREPHSAIDGGHLRAEEFYANIDPDDLREWLSDFSKVTIDEQGDDIRAKAVK